MTLLFNAQSTRFFNVQEYAVEGIVETLLTSSSWADDVARRPEVLEMVDDT